MFAVAALAGVLLSAAAPANQAEPPANRAEPPAPPARAVQEAPDRVTSLERQSGTVLAEDTVTFGRSMVVSGAAALTVSVIGLVIVGWRRRLW